jgi:3',5'-cyclic AMP phosphodiesterase CpdA
MSERPQELESRHANGVLAILHISDLHFGPKYLPRVGEALQSAAAALDPDIIVVSGDFTQRAKREQFAAARAFLDRLPPRPMVVTPGNHDIPLYRVFERIFSPESLYREYISEELNTVLYRDDAVIVSLNSTSPLRSVTNGRLSKRQLEFTADAFRSAPPAAVRVVVTHHNLAPAPDFEGGAVMHGAERIIKQLAGMHVDLILAGHLHRAYNASSFDLCAEHPLGSGIRLAQAGTATSSRGRGRERGRNTFNMIRVEEGSIRITPHLYFEDLEGFAPISHAIYPRAGRWETATSGRNQ